MRFELAQRMGARWDRLAARFDQVSVVRSGEGSDGRSTVLYRRDEVDLTWNHPGRNPIGLATPYGAVMGDRRASVHEYRRDASTGKQQLERRYRLKNPPPVEEGYFVLTPSQRAALVDSRGAATPIGLTSIINMSPDEVHERIGVTQGEAKTVITHSYER
jgi:hypothetical protein